MRKRSSAPIIAMSGQKMLKNTLELFESGVDDVVHVPIHLREILARTAAIARRRVGRAAEALRDQDPGLLQRT